MTFGFSNTVPEIRIDDTTILGVNADCTPPDSSGGSGGSTRSVDNQHTISLPTSATSKLLYGCGPSTTTVSLRDSGRNKLLASVSITVRPLPQVLTDRQVAYRWLNITWSAGHPDYTYTVQWRRETETDSDWKTLSETPATTKESDRSRAIITTGLGQHSADVRGLPFKRGAGRANTDREILVRIAAAAGGHSVYSDGYAITRDKPGAVGHQHDQAIGYNLSTLPNNTLGTMLTNAAPGGATAWSNAVSYLSAHSGSEVDLVEFDGTSARKCRTGPTACVKMGFSDHLEDAGFRIPSGMTMVFYPNPEYESRNYIWTHDASKHLDDAPNGGRYMWVVPVLVHEFGHTFGLSHSTFGIMNPSDVFDEDVAIATIQPADVAAIRQLYDGHIASQGW